MKSLRVVLDANVAAAALIRPDGWSAREISRSDVEWFAPAFLAEELEKHAPEYASKAGCTTPQWSRRVRAFGERVRPVSPAAILAAAQHPLVKKAEKVDADDAVYFAAVVAVEADLLWTRDAALHRAFPGLAVAVVPPLDAS